MPQSEIIPFAPPERPCRVCHKIFPIGEFRMARGAGGKLYRMGKCVDCLRRDEANRRIVILYGMTMKEYTEMLRKQNYLCAICLTDKSPKAKLKFRPFHVDHDHQTGKVRGLLCHKCNALLGMAGDSTDVLKSAIDYLTASGRR